MVCSSCRGETRFDWRTHSWTHREASNHEIFPVVPADEEKEDFEEVEPIPEPEVRATPRTIEELPSRSGMRQIANLLEKEGWRFSISYARGPYLSAAGKMLSVSDSIVIRGVDNGSPTRRIVLSWRDGKFDFAYAGYAGKPWFAIGSPSAKSWIRREDVQLS